MLTAEQLATIQSALDNLVKYSPSALGSAIEFPAEFKTLGISTYFVKYKHYYATCNIEGLDVSANGASRITALRNLFKALHNCAVLNEPSLTVPFALREPTKARAEARAERKAQRDAAWQADLDRAVTAVEAERAAPTIIVPPDAEAGTEGTFKALLGLRTEQKIVALANALRAAGVTLHRVEEDGCPIVRASMPDYHPQFGTLTVLNL